MTSHRCPAFRAHDIVNVLPELTKRIDLQSTFRTSSLACGGQQLFLASAAFALCLPRCSWRQALCTTAVHIHHAQCSACDFQRIEIHV